MTTVCFDGRYLAADTAAHRSGVPSNLLQPKIDLCEGFAYAISGAWLAAFGDLIAWHRAGAGVNAFPAALGDLKGGMMVVEIATARMWLVSSECHWLDEEAAPFGCGSGGDFAVAAIDCGRNAMEAVAVAARRDVHTNDIIDFIDLQAPEFGVQRWEGYPSSKCPHPVNEQRWGGDGIAARRGPRTCAERKADERLQTLLCATENGIAERCPSATTDELLAVLASQGRAQVQTYFDGETGKLITAAADICEHGYVLRTCERCSRHAPAPSRSPA